jgi:circadian clock protein KaiB
VEAVNLNEGLNQNNIDFCEKGGTKYDLYLYIAGSSARSQRAIANIKKICEDSLQGICSLKVVDIFQQPQAAKDDQIFAVPALIKKMPAPIRLFVGDMSNIEDILAALEG